jgi:hypothetical protein
MLLLGLGAKRLGLLHELMPRVNLIGVLVNPNFAMPRRNCETSRARRNQLG